MYLSKLQVQHYKSLDDVSVDFAPDVTLVVGPNGVGKSNFVDVLRFLRDAVVEDLEHAVTKREGIQRLLQTYKTKPYQIGIEIHFGWRPSDPPVIRIANYKLRFKAIRGGNYAVESESGTYFELFAPKEFPKWQFDRSSIPDVSIDSLALVLASKTSPDSPPSNGFVAQHIAEWNFCTIYPNTLRKPAVADRDLQLKESGENWASVIKALKRSPKGREALDRIYDAMRTVLPGFIEVSIQTVGSYLVPLFKFRMQGEGEGEGELVSFDPVQLSDGTLRFFGILLAAYQLPAPKLLVIEEPEQTIYPAALAVLADVFKEVGRTTQVLVTTHSPHLIQFFAPEQIRVAVMHKGMTQIRPIHPHQVEAVKEGLLSLEEFMTSEGLRPADPEPPTP